MDGNGRWASQRGLARTEGHQAGVGVLKTIVKACLERGIPVLSVWAFGRENWARPANEVAFLMALFLNALKQECEELHQSGVCLRFTGERITLSPELRQQMDDAEAFTAKNQRLILNVMFNYGGKWDILQAAKKLAHKAVETSCNIEDLTEADFECLLDTHGLPDPDLFIRTSGEQRLSNFFLWQVAYAEFYFSSVCWPDFTTDEFDHALTWFASRERRFGKTSQQLLEEHDV